MEIFFGGGRVGVWGAVECCIARNAHTGNTNNFCFSESEVPAFSWLRTVLWIRNDFFRIPGSYFSVGFGSYMNFSNININFTLYSRLVNVLGHIFWRDIGRFLGNFFMKKECIFLFEHFCWEISVFQSGFTSNSCRSLAGSGMIIRIHNTVRSERKKIIYVNSTTQRCQKIEWKLFSLFWWKIFSIYHRCLKSKISWKSPFNKRNSVQMPDTLLCFLIL